MDHLTACNLINLVMHLGSPKHPCMLPLCLLASELNVKDCISVDRNLYILMNLLLKYQSPHFKDVSYWLPVAADVKSSHTLLRQDFFRSSWHVETRRHCEVWGLEGCGRQD